MIPLYPDFVLSLSRDLAEIMSILFIMAALVACRKSRYLLYNLLITLAILTKETSSLAAVAEFICLPALWNKQKVQVSTIVAFLIPFLVYGIWQVVLFMIWGDWPLLDGSINIGAPFSAFISFLRYAFTLSTHMHRRWVIELVLIIIFTLSVGRVYFKSEILMHIKISCLFYFFLCFSLSDYIWLEDWAFMRALSEFFLFGYLILMGSKNRARVPVFIYSLAVWLYLFRAHAFY